MRKPRVSIVIPALDEGDGILPAIQRLADAVHVDHEILVVVDSSTDSTIAAISSAQWCQGNTRILIQSYGRGPANAIRFGFDHAEADVTVVTMADGSDDVRVIDDLVRLVERGCVIAAASRYMPGGAQIGGPRLKKLMSWGAGVSLHYLAGVGTRDATNSFKAYKTKFVQEVGIDSRGGFEIAIELVAKARRLRLPIAELPTIWLDRDLGVSKFQLRSWLPNYVAWYKFTYGRRLSAPEIRARCSASERIIG